MADVSQILITIQQDVGKAEQSKDKLTELSLGIDKLTHAKRELENENKRLWTSQKKLDESFRLGDKGTKEYGAATTANTAKIKANVAAINELSIAKRNLQQQHKTLIATGTVQHGSILDPKVPKQTAINFQQLVFKIMALVGTLHFFKSILGGLIKEYTQWEYSMANVLTLLDQTDGQLEKVSIKVISKYGFAVKDVNKALFDAISAMIPAAEAAGFMDAAARLAIGGVTNLKTAVDGLTSIINTYTLDISEANRVADAFFRAQKFGKTTVQLLTDNIGRVAPIARAANVSYQEMLSILAELTLGGLNTEESVTALRQAINGLISPADQARAKMEEFGVPFGISQIGAVGLRFALLKLTEAFQKAPDAFAEMIPNIRAFTGVAALTQERLTHLNMITEDVIANWGEFSSLTFAMDKQLDTVQKKWEILTGRIQANKIVLVEHMSGALKFVVDKWNIFGTLLNVIGGILIATMVKLGGVTKALIAMRAAMVAAFTTPIGLITTVAFALAGLIRGLILYKKRTEEATAVTRSLSEALDKELWTLNELFNQAKQMGGLDDPKLASQRLEAIKQLINLYPDYLKELALEKKTLSELAEIQKEITGYVKARKASEMEGADFDARLMKAVHDANKIIHDFIDYVKQFSEAPPELLGELTGALEKLAITGELGELMEAYEKIEWFPSIPEGNKRAAMLQDVEVMFRETVIAPLADLREQYDMTQDASQKFFDSYKRSVTGVSTIPTNVAELERNRNYSDASINLLEAYYIKRQVLYENDTQEYRKALIVKELAEVQSLIRLKKIKEDQTDENFALFEVEYRELELDFNRGEMQREDFYKRMYEIAEKYEIATEYMIKESAQRVALHRSKWDTVLMDAKIKEIQRYNFYVGKALNDEKELSDSQREELRQAVIKYNLRVEKETRKFYEDMQDISMQYYDVMLDMMVEGDDKVRMKLRMNNARSVIAAANMLNQGLEELKAQYEKMELSPDAVLNKKIYEERVKDWVDGITMLIDALKKKLEHDMLEIEIKIGMDDRLFQFAYPRFDIDTIHRDLEAIENQFLSTRTKLISDWEKSSDDMSDNQRKNSAVQLEDWTIMLREKKITMEDYLDRVKWLLGEESDLYKHIAQTLRDEVVESYKKVENAKNDAFGISNNMVEFMSFLTKMNSLLDKGYISTSDFIKATRQEMREQKIKFSSSEARRNFRKTGEVDTDDLIAIPDDVVERWEQAKEKIIDVVSSLSREIMRIWAEHDRREYERARDAMQDRNDTEQEILKNRLDKGLYTEDQYKKRKAELDEKYRRREEALKREQFEKDKRRAIAEIWVNAVIGMSKAFATKDWKQALIDSAAIAIEAGVMTALVDSQNYAKGGIIGGNLHSAGGTKFIGSDGSAFEAERGELLAIVNRHDTAMLQALSDANSGHGKSFFGKGGTVRSFSDGGMMSRDITRAINNQELVNAIKNLNLVVYVEDISDALQKKTLIESKSIF